MFKKKTKEQQIQHRVDEVFFQLTKDTDFTFTELETVQILNSVKRKAHEYLSEKKADCLEQSAQQLQKAEEINAALELFA